MNRWFKFGLGTAAALTMGLTGVVAASATTSSPAPAVRAATPPPPGIDQLGSQSANAAQGTNFVPLAPCRVLDSRLGGGQILGGTIRNMYVPGTFGFAPQGGTAGGCQVPLNATAVAATVLSVNATSTGRITAYPSAAAAPTATTLYFSKGVTTSTGATLSLSPGAAKQLAIKAYATTDVVVDVSGYYVKQIYGTFTDTGALYNGNGTLAAYAHPSTGHYTLHADRDLTGCAVAASSYYYTFNVSAYTSGEYVYVQMTQYNGTDADYYFHVLIDC